MTKVTIEVNGREVSEEEAKRMIFDKFLTDKINQVKAAIGDLPVEIAFRGSLQELKLSVKNCPAELVPELRRRLEPFVRSSGREVQPATFGRGIGFERRNSVAGKN
jgi:hypothetical protein